MCTRLSVWLIPAVLLAFTLLLVCPGLVTRGDVFALGDVPDQFLPWREFVRSEIAEGRIPLWNRFSFCGTPFLANMQSCVLYPLDRLADLIFPAGTALSLGVLFHLWMGGLFLYALVVHFGASRWAALVSGVGYALGGFHAIHLLGGNLLTITSSVYLPAHLLAISVLAGRVERGERAGWCPALAALCGALQVLSGHAQMVFYNALFAGIFVLVLLLQMRERRWRLLGWLMAAGATSFLLAAPQILPTLEYSRISSRTGALPYDAATEFSFGWEFLLSLFLPEYLGTRADVYTPLHGDTFWGDWKNWSAVYIGILPAVGFLWFLLSLGKHILLHLRPLSSIEKGDGRLSMDSRLRGNDNFTNEVSDSSFPRRRESMAIPFFPNTVMPLIIMGLVGLFLALGKNNPLYPWIHSLPLFGQFRAPSKYLPGFIVPVAVLGAVGLSHLREVIERSLSDSQFSMDSRLRRNDDLMSEPPTSSFPRRRESTATPLYALGGGLVGVMGFLAVLFLPSVHYAVTPLGLICREFLRSLSLLVLAGGILSVGSRLGVNGRQRRSIRITSLALVMLALFDLGFYFKKYAVTAPPELLRLFPVELIRKHLHEGERVLVTPEVPHLNETIPAGISTPGGYDPFQVGVYMDEFRRLGIIQPGEIPDAWTPPVEQAADLSVGLVVTHARLQSANLTPVDRDPNWFLYRVRNPRPFLEFVSGDSATATMGDTTAETSLSASWKGERLLLRGFVPKKGLLTIRQTYVPGWEWRESGGEWRGVQMVKPFWQSIEVNPGALKTELRYRPVGWVFGLRLFPLGLIGWGLIATMRLRRRTP